MILPVKGTHLVFMVGPFQEIFKIESSLSLGLVACYHSCYHIYCRLLPVITAPCAGQQAILQAANKFVFLQSLSMASANLLSASRLMSAHHVPRRANHLSLSLSAHSLSRLPSQSQLLVNPTPFLAALVGKNVRVRLKWGQEYQGKLASSDAYMNLELQETEEFIDGQFAGALGEVLIRCNNVLYVKATDLSGVVPMQD